MGLLAVFKRLISTRDLGRAEYSDARIELRIIFGFFNFVIDVCFLITAALNQESQKSDTKIFVHVMLQQVYKINLYQDPKRPKGDRFIFPWAYLARPWKLSGRDSVKK
ncbi:hypothetical protein TU85_12795 [Pseudomonas helleri]|nr:hypothetical protein TU85_12795 [Pseudomonas helleri]